MFNTIILKMHHDARCSMHITTAATIYLNAYIWPSGVKCKLFVAIPAIQEIETSSLCVQL